MPPQAVALALFAIQEAIKEGPELYRDIQAIFAKPEPTAQDWEALRAKVLAKSYADYVPTSALK